MPCISRRGAFFYWLFVFTTAYFLPFSAIAEYVPMFQQSGLLFPRGNVHLQCHCCLNKCKKRKKINTVEPLCLFVFLSYLFLNWIPFLFSGRECSVCVCTTLGVVVAVVVDLSPFFTYLLSLLLLLLSLSYLLILPIVRLSIGDRSYAVVVIVVVVVVVYVCVHVRCRRWRFSYNPAPMTSY